MSQQNDEVNEIDLNQLLMNAASIADDLLRGGLECVPVLLEYHDKPSAAESMLIVGHALLAQRDMQNESTHVLLQRLLKSIEVIAENLSDIAESLDFIAATKPDAGS
ncbi:hypothetical protein [Methylobacillus flagellatus]|uniref:hypothetical protein n=1 Tax=Methylobacillus flagellatus TaxID=405 RepID=UPI0010F592DE|nr:hypothetical protein [Methylobacillus flagellatus]